MGSSIVFSSVLWTGLVLVSSRCLAVDLDRPNITNVQSDDSRRVGGRGANYAAPEQYPYVVLLITYFESEPGYYSHCTGSILHETLVLTAAHCVVKRHTGELLTILGSPASSVYVGATSLDNYESKHRIKEAQYSKDHDLEWTADVALIRTETKMLGSGSMGRAVELGCLPTGDSVTVDVIGHGHDAWSERKLPPTNGDEPSYALTAGSMKTVSNSVCRKEVPEPYDPDDRLYICLTSAGTDAYTASGDSGGPIIYKGKLVGTVKGGNNGFTSAENISFYNFKKWLEGFRNRNSDNDDTITPPSCE